MNTKVATASGRGGLLLAALAFVLSLLAGPAMAQEVPDTAPPTVTAVSPAGDVARPTEGVTATFSEPMDPATIDATTFTLKKGEAAVVAADITYDGLSDRATFVFAPGERLVQGATYTAAVGTGATDTAGNPLDADPAAEGAQAKTWTFRIADVEDPTVTLVEPGADTEARDSVRATATAADNVGVDRVEFVVDGTTRVRAARAHDPAGDSYSAEIDTSGYAHGSTHTVAAQAFDTGGNASETSATSTVTIDREVSLSLGDAPAAGGFTNAASVPLSFTTDPDVVDRGCRALLSGEPPGPFAPCTSPTSFMPNLTRDGGYTYEVKVTDDVGNVATASRSFTLDRTAPNLVISSGPDGGTFGPNTTQGWTFAADDATGGPPGVECRVAAVGGPAGFGECSTAASHSVSDRPDGSYEFSVRATDGAGNQKVVTTRPIRIDATPPTATLVSPVGGQKVGKTMTLEANAADDLPGPKVEFLVDGKVEGTDPSAPYAATLDMSVYPHDSPHAVAARAVDGVGNRSALSEAAVRVDRQVSLTLGGSPAPSGFTNAASAPLAFTADGDVPAAGRECQVERGGEVLVPYEVCASPFSPDLAADGKHTYRVRVTDDVGNTASAARTFTLDRTNPTLEISGGPGDQVFGPNTTQVWTFSAGDATSGPPRVECSVVPRGAEASYGPCKTATSHSVSSRPDGAYEFRVRAADDAGNGTSLARAFTIDATPPGVIIATGLDDLARTNRSDLTWTFSAVEAGATFECRSYPEPFFPCPSFGACSGTSSHEITGLSAGNYVFEVRARDAFDNVDGRPLVRRFAVDTNAPTLLKTSPAAGARKVAPSANVTATFSEKMLPGTVNRLNVKLFKAGSGRPVGARVTLNQTTNTATLNPTNALARGTTYRAAVTAGTKDLAGNPLTVGRTWNFKVR